MSWRAEIYSSLYALWRLLRLDPNAPRYFNLTTEGFWRSFAVAAVLILGTEVLLQFVLNNSPGAEEIIRPANGVLLGSMPKLLLLLVYPILLIPLTRLFRLSPNYVTYIIAWNWMSALTIGTMVVVFVPVAVFEIPLKEISVLVTVVNLLLISYAVYLAKLALQSNVLTAIGFIALDLVLGELLSRIF